MNSALVRNTARLLAVAMLTTSTAIGATVGLTGTAFAAPTCEKYSLVNNGSGILQINQSDKQVVRIPVSGSTFAGPGKALYSKPGDRAATAGRAFGGVTGRRIDITVHWDVDHGGGKIGTYVGDINDQGISSGRTWSEKGANATWRGSMAHSCISATPPPDPTPSAPKPPKQIRGKLKATVTKDVDLFAQPHGVGLIRVLRENEVVVVAKPCVVDDHCELKEPKGFAWGEFLKNN